MALLTKPAPYVDNVSAWAAADVNALLNALYDTFGSLAGSPGGGTNEGTIDNSNVKTGAAILPAKMADTAMVLGNTVNPGTQTCSRPTIFSGESLASSIGSTPTVYTGGILTAQTVPVVANGPATLQSYTLPANSLTTTGRGIRIRAWGTKASTVNPATVQLQIDGASIISKQLPTTAVGVTSWECEVVIERTGANAQSHHSDAWHSCGTTGLGTMGGTDGPLVASQTVAGTLALTDAGAHVIRVQATAATNPDVTQLGMTVEAI